MEGRRIIKYYDLNKYKSLQNKKKDAGILYHLSALYEKQEVRKNEII